MQAHIPHWFPRSPGGGVGWGKSEGTDNENYTSVTCDIEWRKCDSLDDFQKIRLVPERYLQREKNKVKGRNWTHQVNWKQGNRDRSVVHHWTHNRDRSVVHHWTHNRDSSVVHHWTHNRDSSVVHHWTHNTNRDSSVIHHWTHNRTAQWYITGLITDSSVCVCVCVCVCACMLACVRACVRVCVCVIFYWSGGSEFT